MQRPSSFPDVKLILDEALACGGGTYVCTSRGMAVSFRHRCYKFRTACAETFGDLRYEALSFPRIPPDSCEVNIVVTVPRGTFIPARSRTEVETLDSSAARLRAKLGDLI